MLVKYVMVIPFAAIFIFGIIGISYIHSKNNYPIAYMGASIGSFVICIIQWLVIAIYQ